uniref:LIM zinc-binding domain-containing protein n=1 Tax=Amphiprion percula TaxID=161767 RepID=A0A3P8SNT7_AMPPE
LGSWGGGSSFWYVQVLQARGKSYHPSCFCCVVCRQNLEGQSFAVDSDCRIYCVTHMQEKKGDSGSLRRVTSTVSSVPVTFSVRLVVGFRVQAPRCAACRKPILPTEVSLTANSAF